MAPARPRVASRSSFNLQHGQQLTSSRKGSFSLTRFFRWFSSWHASTLPSSSPSSPQGSASASRPPASSQPSIFKAKMLSVPLRPRQRWILLGLCALATALIFSDVGGLLKRSMRKENLKGIGREDIQGQPLIGSQLNKSSLEQSLPSTVTPPQDTGTSLPATVTPLPDAVTSLPSTATASSAEEPTGRAEPHEMAQGVIVWGSYRFRGASWKPPVYKWLASCWEPYLQRTPNSVEETLFGKDCPLDCSGNGVCNRQLGECRCRMGFKGADCLEEGIFECNKPARPDLPLGEWVVTICPAHCDKRTSHCFCGPDTPHPHRSIIEPCGFSFDSQKNDFDHSRPNTELLFDPKEGYCFVSQADAANLAKKFEACGDCLDGLTGPACSVVNQAYCPTQCSGHGTCHRGFCKCVDGFSGIDCSTPSAVTPPELARISPVIQGGSLKTDAAKQDVSAVYLVPKRRPLIYIYDLPYEYTAHHLEGRAYPQHCVPWLYTEDNETVDNPSWRYSMEAAVIGSLLVSSHRTLNAEEADYFLVPIFGGCITVRADDSPSMDMQRDYLTLRPYFAGAYYQRAYEYISQRFPFWNRHGGKDHIWIFPWDEGACSAPQSIWPSIMLSHWGNTMTHHKGCVTSYDRDQWQEVPASLRGDHPCFDPDKDIVMPAYRGPAPGYLKQVPQESRTKLFYFNNFVDDEAPEEKTETQPRLHIGANITRYFSGGDFLMARGIKAAPDVSVTKLKEEDEAYEQNLLSSLFCGVAPGEGFSARLEDSVLHGCIPVIIQDGIQLPFENFLSYDQFSIRVVEGDIPSLLDTLRAVPPDSMREMLQALRSVASRLYYRSFLEREVVMQRQQSRPIPGAAEWTLDVIRGDDAIDTLVQILAFKLHSDPWRPLAKESSACGF